MIVRNAYRPGGTMPTSTPFPDLLRECEQFIGRTGMKISTFGRLAMNDPTFLHRLRKLGDNVRPATAEKVRKFMSEQAE